MSLVNKTYMFKLCFITVGCKMILQVSTNGLVSWVDIVFPQIHFAIASENLSALGKAFWTLANLFVRSWPAKTFYCTAVQGKVRQGL